VDISGGAVIVHTSCVYRWPVNPVSNPNPICSQTLNCDSIEMDLRGIEWSGMDWINLAEDRVGKFFSS
jgi:hypothetical protein